MILESQERDQVTPWWPHLLPWESFQTVRLRRRIWEALRRSPELETELRVQGDRAATVHRAKYMRGESFTERRPPDTCRRSPRSVQQRTNQHRVRGNHPRLKTGQSTRTSTQQDQEECLSHQTRRPHNSYGFSHGK